MDTAYAFRVSPNATYQFERPKLYAPLSSDTALYLVHFSHWDPTVQSCPHDQPRVLLTPSPFLAAQFTSGECHALLTSMSQIDSLRATISPSGQWHHLTQPGAHWVDAVTLESALEEWVQELCSRPGTEMYQAERLVRVASRALEALKWKDPTAAPTSEADAPTTSARRTPTGATELDLRAFARDLEPLARLARMLPEGTTLRLPDGPPAAAGRES